jgi:hypothetical protein
MQKLKLKFLVYPYLENIFYRIVRSTKNNVLLTAPLRPHLTSSSKIPDHKT